VAGDPRSVEDGGRVVLGAVGSEGTSYHRSREPTANAEEAKRDRKYTGKKETKSQDLFKSLSYDKRSMFSGVGLCEPWLYSLDRNSFICFNLFADCLQLSAIL
jgi:hypothetical protein